MHDKGLISKEWSEMCEELHGTAVEHGVDTVYPLVYGDMGYPLKKVYTLCL